MPHQVIFLFNSYCLNSLSFFFYFIKTDTATNIEDDSKSASKAASGDYFGGSDGISANQFGSVTDIFFSQIQYRTQSGGLCHLFYFFFFLFSHSLKFPKHKQMMICFHFALTKF